MRDWITKDFWWKLFSVVLAVSIWLTVHKIYEPAGGTAAVDNTLTFGSVQVIPVSTAGDVSDYRLTQPDVSVTVSGPNGVVGDLRANQIHAIVDLSDISTNRELKRVVEISVPPGVKLVNVDPPKIGVLPPPQHK
jgi:YbbR domain-containing protein